MDPILQQALARAQPGETGTAATPAKVGELKTWSNGEYTRVVVYLSHPVTFRREVLPAQGATPARLVIDLEPAQLGDSLQREVGDAIVQRVRAAQHDAGTVRVVLDLAGREESSVFALQDPARVIVDVGSAPPRAPTVTPPHLSTPPVAVGEGASGPLGSREALAREEGAPGLPPPTPRNAAPSPTGERRAASPSPEARAARAAEPGESELTARRPIRRIVVDAGHGGHDTGAIGPTGVREKDVTLAMARRLARRLRARGFEVVLTRDDDRYLALEERTAIANARHGDLFVSLHANAHPKRDRRGVETYFLNVTDDRYAARLAARENGAFEDDAATGPEVRRILSDLDASSSAEASRRLAREVQRELCDGIRDRFGEVRDLGVKSALFYVLLGARMPAVLVETSFISNRVEEKRLRDGRFQEEVASGVARAVERFAARDARVAAAR